MSKFTHLHVHSHYSLLDGLPKIDELLDCAKELGMNSIALTDHGVMYGAIEFYKKAKEVLESKGYHYYGEDDIKGIGSSHASKPDYIAVKGNVVVIGEI